MSRREHLHFEECRELAVMLIPALRHAAKLKGYALASHGTNAYDIDLVACPWAEGACPAEELMEAVRRAAEGITGFAFINPKGAEQKPHGRLGWAIHIGGGPYIDLSVMPTVCKNEDAEHKRDAETRPGSQSAV